jgi:hypothetical protein
MENNTSENKAMSFRERLQQAPAVVEFYELLAEQRKQVEALRAEHDAKKPKDV